MGYASYPRKDRLIQERRHDAYQEQGKWPEPTRCGGCGAVFAQGRWSWKKPSKNMDTAICPACRRDSDRYPAGRIEIRGRFFQEHREEILNLIGNVAQQEMNQHPLERIMKITLDRDHTLVTTTGIHIARRIGEALSRSYKGAFSFHYPDGAKNIRVYWQR